MAVSAEFQKQLEGYGLTTAEILYRMPDHPALLQTYLWQDYDLYPQFPNLHHFLDFWSHQLDGVLHTITVAHRELIRPTQFRIARDICKLH